MFFSITQIILLFFLFFALSRVFLRFKGGTLSLPGLVFWSLIFGMAIIGIIFPNMTSRLANISGIGRGVDAVIYISIALLFYLVFRIYIFLEDIRREISELVKKISLKEINEKRISKNKHNRSNT